MQAAGLAGIKSRPRPMGARLHSQPLDLHGDVMTPEGRLALKSLGYAVMAVFALVMFAVIIKMMNTTRLSLAQACHERGGAFIPDTGGGYALCLRANK
jgi:hypothetical protein